MAHDVGWVSMAGATNTRTEIDAMHQYEAEADGEPSVGSRLPGWILIAILVAAFLFVVFFTTWA